MSRIFSGLASLPLLLVVAVAGPASGQLITPEGVEELQQLKALVYRGLTLAHAAEVEAGTAQPAVYSEVDGRDAPVSYYHYPVRKDRLQALAAAIPLPEGFSLAPIRVVRRTPPGHYITLTVYRVAGERSGLRAEWTTYVLADGDTRPRVMMLETATSDGSLDPVDLFSEPADFFQHGRSGDVVKTKIVWGDSSFAAWFRVPRDAKRGRIIDSSWGAAGDVVYWRNGVADRHYVNGLVANRRVTSLPGLGSKIRNRTRWAAFVERDPRWALLFDQRIDSVIEPWVNADDPSLSLEPAFREQLLETRASVFSANEFQRAEDISDRAAEPLADFFVEPTPPSVYLNFEILPEQREALAAAIPLPAGFELARVKTLRRGPRRHLLSLNIYQTQGIAAGLRAEWSVYVTKNGDPAPRYMILEAQSDSFSLDPVNGFTQAADLFEYVLEDGVLRVDVRNPGTSFQATIPLPEDPARRKTTLSWAEANNRIYWRNGVADKIYYNGLIYDAPVAVVPTESVSVADGSAWAGYLRLAEVLVYENQLEFIASPWNNLNQLEDEVGAP